MKKNIIIVCFIFMILIIAFCKRISSAGNLCIKENLLTIFPLLIEYGAILDKKSLELAEITTEGAVLEVINRLQKGRPFLC